MPLVAIVTPVYNGETYLAQTMDAVQAQTYGNIVHVLLDNASNDATPEIINRYRNGRVPLLVFRNPETLPIRENWNAAFAHVPSEAVYMRILCADDVITPDCIAEMAQLAEANPGVGIVGSHVEMYGRPDSLLWPADRTVIDGPEAIRMALLLQGRFIAPHVMMRKSVADQRQPLFQPPAQLAFDLDTTLALLEHSQFGIVHKTLGSLREHEGTMTARFADRARVWHAEGLLFLRRYGPNVLGETYGEHLLRYRRYYVRRILAWRRADGGDQHNKIHFEALRSAGWTWGPGLIADALLDWGLIKLGRRRNWEGYPGWQ